jgi:hypothetical protein
MRIRDTFIVYLQHRIIIFPLHEYLNSFIKRIIEKMDEWYLIKDKKISGKEKYFKFFVEKEINDILLEIKIVYKDLNLKVFTIFKNQENLSLDYEEFFEDKNLVIQSICKCFKKISKKYFSDKIPLNLKFNTSTNFYKKIKCGDPTGDEIEFLTNLK